MTDEKTKLCKSCNQEQPLSAFYLNLRDDYAHECWKCRILAKTGGGNGPVIEKPLTIDTSSEMKTENALLEISMLNGESSNNTFDDVVIEGTRNKIPREVLTRMKDLWEKTEKIGGEIIKIGKIIVIKIIAFLKAHPNLTSSLALSAAVYFLAQSIPFFGPLLAPLLAVVTGVFTYASTSSFDDAVKMANDFFKLLVDIFRSVADHLNAGSVILHTK